MLSSSLLLLCSRKASRYVYACVCVCVCVCVFSWQLDYTYVCVCVFVWACLRSCSSLASSSSSLRRISAASPPLLLYTDSCFPGRIARGYTHAYAQTTAASTVENLTWSIALGQRISKLAGAPLPHAPVKGGYRPGRTGSAKTNVRRALHTPTPSSSLFSGWSASLSPSLSLPLHLSFLSPHSLVFRNAGDLPPFLLSNTQTPPPPRSWKRCRRRRRLLLLPSLPGMHLRLARPHPRKAARRSSPPTFRASSSRCSHGSRRCPRTSLVDWTIWGHVWMTWRGRLKS